MSALTKDIEATAGSDRPARSEESSITKPSSQPPSYLNSEEDNGNDNGSPGSNTPVLAAAPQKRFSIQALAAHFTETPDTAYADIILIFCCYITGLVDSSTYNAWTVFSGMQTGELLLCFAIEFND
jgi:hypothetical protein